MNLRIWVQKTGEPLSSMSPELYSALQNLQTKEVHEDILDKISPLLKGEPVSLKPIIWLVVFLRILIWSWIGVCLAMACWNREQNDPIQSKMLSTKKPITVQKFFLQKISCPWSGNHFQMRLRQTLSCTLKNAIRKLSFLLIRRFFTIRPHCRLSVWR